MNRILILIIVSLTAFTFAFAQSPNKSTPPDAREVMVKFAELNNKQLLQTDEAHLLFSGDASEWKMAWFGQISASPDKIISIEKDYSVARIQTVRQNLRTVDLYFYILFEGGWKIRSMRAMAKTGWIESVVETLKSKTELTAEEKSLLANSELVLSSDKTLTEWFQKDRAAFDKIADLALLETNWKPIKPPEPPKPEKMPDGSVRSIGRGVSDDLNDEPRTIERITANTPKFPKSAAALKNLHITALETKDDGSIEFTIGGVLDNTVGFIYSPKDAPPKIDRWRYIWVEKLAVGWYLFRTT